LILFDVCAPSILSEEEVIALIHTSILPNCVLPTLVIQESEQKSIEEQAGEFLKFAQLW
jgi:hypothetical protein